MVKHGSSKGQPSLLQDPFMKIAIVILHCEDCVLNANPERLENFWNLISIKKSRPISMKHVQIRQTITFLSLA